MNPCDHPGGCYAKKKERNNNAWCAAIFVHARKKFFSAAKSMAKSEISL
jgi:hypothetical protein